MLEQLLLLFRVPRPQLLQFLFNFPNRLQVNHKHPLDSGLPGMIASTIVVDVWITYRLDDADDFWQWSPVRVFGFIPGEVVQVAIHRNCASIASSMSISIIKGLQHLADSTHLHRR